MDCKNCGTQLPEDANFCLKCGRPQTDGATGGEPKLEVCIIDFSVEEKSGFLKPPKIKFVAQAMNPYGKYITNHSPVINGERSYEVEFPPENNQEDYDAALQALTDLTHELEKSGWKMIGTTGKKYWQLRFRRQMK